MRVLLALLKGFIITLFIIYGMMAVVILHQLSIINLEVILFFGIWYFATIFCLISDPTHRDGRG